MVRQKNRYLLVRSMKEEGEPNIENKIIINGILEIIKKHYGIFGVGRLRRSLKIKYSGIKTGYLIIKIPRDCLVMFNNLFSNYLIELKGLIHSSTFDLVHVSGSIKLASDSLLKLENNILSKVPSSL